MSARQKTYAAPHRPKLESQFGFDGPWNGKRRVLEPSARQSRQHQPCGGLSQDEWQALSPEQKLALAHGGTMSE